MPEENLESLRKKLNKIITEEIGDCLRSGATDLETVAVRVEKRASVIISQLAPPLAAAEVRAIIQRMMKKVAAAKPDDPRQMEFAGMEEFKGIPHNVTYEREIEVDGQRVRRVGYISYLDTFTWERDAALALLGNSIAADQQAFLYLKAGNDFAASLVERYGDLPLRELYQRWKASRQAGSL